MPQKAWAANMVPQKQVSLSLGTCELPLVILRHPWEDFEWVFAFKGTLTPCS